jgi:hypothetical protein
MSRGREVERLKLIHMPDFGDPIYDFRANAMFGILALTVDQIIRVVDHRPAPDSLPGSPPPDAGNSPRSGCSARSTSSIS